MTPRPDPEHLIYVIEAMCESTTSDDTIRAAILRTTKELTDWTPEWTHLCLVTTNPDQWVKCRKVENGLEGGGLFVKGLGLLEPAYDYKIRALPDTSEKPPEDKKCHDCGVDHGAAPPPKLV